MLLLKYAAVLVTSGLWAFGLSDQFGSIEATATYLLISGAMVVVALF